MPIPKPTNKDDKKSFIERCMSDSGMNTEYTDPKQRYAICINKWEEKKNTAASVIVAADNEFLITKD